MFATLARSWEYAKISYGILWENKSLVVFPILSSIAALIVLASFIVPAWSMGLIQEAASTTQTAAETGGEGSQLDVLAIVLTFLMYFCLNFVILFFNAALVGCTMRAINGEPVSIGAGLGVAASRLGPIIGWALVSAVVSTLLVLIENANKKAGRFVSAILGSAWTALTYFVLPVLVVDGVGPVEAFKRSTSVLKDNWGTALVGNFSLNFLGLLVIVPIALVGGGLVWMVASAGGGMAAIVAAVGVGAALLAIGFAINSAADVIFKALLFHYATGRSVPADVDGQVLADAFVSR